MAIRTTAVLATAAALLTACHHDDPAAETAARSGTPSSLQELRGIDPCALFGAATSVGNRSLTVTGPVKFGSCTATVTDPAGTVDVNIALAWRSPQEPTPAEESWVKHRVIDGVEVTSASLWDQPNLPPRDQVVSASCQFIARYPDGAALMVLASFPPAADGCAIAEAVVTTAIAEYPKRPGWASSKFPTTTLTGTDPCAPVRSLETGHRVDWSSGTTVTSCYFTLDDRQMSVSLVHEPADHPSTRDNPDLGGHQLLGDPAAGQVAVVVGPQFTVGARALLPAVEVSDVDEDTARTMLVARAVADHY